jgi:hypothetical protein
VEEVPVQYQTKSMWYIENNSWIFFVLVETVTQPTFNIHFVLQVYMYRLLCVFIMVGWTGVELSLEWQ